jgi:hypothetical protein
LLIEWQDFPWRNALASAARSAIALESIIKQERC